MTTGERIRAARLNAGLTQKRLSELTGIAEPTIRKYESNRLNPKLETLQRIAAALGVPVESFLDPAMFSTSTAPVASLEDVAEEMAIPVDTVRRLLQSDDPKARQTIAYVRSILTSELSSGTLPRIQSALDQLNAAGQEKAVERVEELTEIPKYQRTPKTLPEAPSGPTDTE